MTTLIIDDEHLLRKALYVLCAIGFVGLVALGFGATFHSDEWNFLTRRSLADPATLFQPFNDQWMTVPIVLYRLVFEVARLTSYLPYLVVLIGIHVLLPLTLNRLMERWSGPIPAFLFAVFVLVSGYGHENLFWAFQIGMVGATVAGFAAIWVLEASAHWRPLVSLLLLVALASHPVAAALLVAAGVLTVGRRRWADVPWIAAPTLLLAIWMLNFQLSGLAGQAGIIGSGMLQIPRFVALGFTSTAAAILGIRPELGLGLLASVGVLFAIRGRPFDTIAFVAFAAGIAAEFTLISLVRSQFGDSATAWARYMYVSVPLLVLAVTAWLGPSPLDLARRPFLRTAVAFLLVLAFVGNVRTLVLGRRAAMEWADRARAIESLAFADPALPEYYIIQFPLPSELPQIVGRFGRLDRDQLLGVRFPPPAPEAFAYVCGFFYEGDSQGAERCTSIGIDAAGSAAGSRYAADGSATRSTSARTRQRTASR